MTRQRMTRSADRRRRHGRRLRRQRGLSLIEASIAAALLLVIAVGTIPMFAQALSNNVAGADSTAASNSARSQTEELFQLPFISPLLTLTAGSELVTEAYFSISQKKWLAGPVPPGSTDALWTRTSTIRQYSVNALDDGTLDPAEALDADADLGQVHLKEIEVGVLGTRSAGPLGPSRRVSVRMLKSQ
jgi:hypothetical protein